MSSRARPSARPGSTPTSDRTDASASAPRGDIGITARGRPSGRPLGLSALGAGPGCDQAALASEHDLLHAVADAQLEQDALDVGLDRRFLDHQGGAISPFERPRATSSTTSRSCGVSSSRRASGACWLAARPITRLVTHGTSLLRYLPPAEIQ